VSARGTLVGVVHLPPLPGSPRSSVPIREIARDAIADTRALADAGFDLVMLENFGDAPFFAGRVPHVTVSAMTAIAALVRAELPSVALGINVLRNDADAALAIATVVSASCVRVNVHIGARVTDQGLIEGRAAETLRTRRDFGADRAREGSPRIAIWADVDVKHSAALASRPLEQEAEDLALRAMADAVLVTGSGTGKSVDLAKLETIKRAVRDVPVLVASGATVAMLRDLARTCDGVIVGSALREGGVPGGAVDPKRAAEFALAFRAAFAAG
jgi:membrane complex biogenesis BtpA family protein